jgi:hypothetical protein
MRITEKKLFSVIEQETKRVLTEQQDCSVCKNWERVQRFNDHDESYARATYEELKSSLKGFYDGKLEDLEGRYKSLGVTDKMIASWDNPAARDSWADGAYENAARDLFDHGGYSGCPSALYWTDKKKFKTRLACIKKKVGDRDPAAGIKNAQSAVFGRMRERIRYIVANEAASAGCFDPNHPCYKEDLEEPKTYADESGGIPQPEENDPTYSPDSQPEPKPIPQSFYDKNSGPYDPTQHKGYVWLSKQELKSHVPDPGVVVMMKHKGLYEMPFFLAKWGKERLKYRGNTWSSIKRPKFKWHHMWGNYPYRGRRTGYAIWQEGYVLDLMPPKLFATLATKLFPEMHPDIAWTSFRQLFDIPEEEAIRRLVVHTSLSPEIGKRNVAKVLRWWDAVKHEEGPEVIHSDWGM